MLRDTLSFYKKTKLLASNVTTYTLPIRTRPQMKNMQGLIKVMYLTRMLRKKIDGQVSMTVYLQRVPRLYHMKGKYLPYYLEIDIFTERTLHF